MWPEEPSHLLPGSAYAKITIYEPTKQAPVWIAIYDPLEVVAEGDTEKEAVVNLIEMVELVLQVEREEAEIKRAGEWKNV